jgi:Uma2 family endonuclease
LEVGEPVSVALFEHAGPWSEEEYLALGETPNRIELIDGDLLMSSAPRMSHQLISRRLANILEITAIAVGLRVFEAINIRLRPGRIVVPDVVVVDTHDNSVVADVAVVRLICEVVSPSNAARDRVFKRELYAAAGIEWYLIAEEESAESVTLPLYRLNGGCYIEHAVAKNGTTLAATGPFDIQVDTTVLVR